MYSILKQKLLFISKGSVSAQILGRSCIHSSLKSGLISSLLTSMLQTKGLNVIFEISLAAALSHTAQFSVSKQYYFP